MKKIFTFILALLMTMPLCAPSFASVGVKDDGTMKGAATDIDFVGGASDTFDGSKYTLDISQPSSITTAGDVTFRSTLTSLGRISASSSLASSSTSVGSTNVPYAIIRKFLGAGAEATTLPNGVSGQVLNITVVVSAGGVWTITPGNSRLITSWTMTAADDSITLLYLNDTLGWIVIGAEGSTAITYDTNLN
jgi:hypothetical protein